MPRNAGKFYEFANFRLDVSRKILLRDDQPLALTPKVFDTLEILIENAGNLLEKDELMQKIWHDHFVEESNLTSNIKTLRKALGDDASRPRFIETVPRRGYRFIAAVRENAVEEEPAAAPRAAAPGTLVSRKILLPVAALIFVAVFIGIWNARTASRASGLPILSAPFVAEKITTNGKTLHAVISADGKNVVYTQGIGSDRQSVWLRQLDTGNNVEIVPPSDDFYYGLALSPDGNFLYFVRAPKTVTRQFDIYRVSIFGGIPTKISGDADGWISISPDGAKISFVRCYYRDDDFCSLFVADALDGKNERKLVSRARPTRIADNKISADGKRVVFAVGQSETAANEFGLMEVEIETGAEREVSPERFFNIKGLAQLPDSGDLLITASRVSGDHFRLWLISANGEAAPLAKDSESYANLSLDETASRLISTQFKTDYRLHLFETENPQASRVLADATSVAFAPDGKILFSSNLSGNYEIWSVQADGSNQRQLTSNPADENAPLASPVNNSIFFASNRTGAVQIWKMDADGSNQTQITRKEGGAPLSISNDGRWLYYLHSLHKTLWRVSTEGGEEQLILNKRKHQIAVSPDGSQAVFAEKQTGENRLVIVRLADGQIIKTFKFADERTVLINLKWSADGNSVTYILAAGEYKNNTFWRQPLGAANPPQKIADLGDERITAAGFAPDGKNFAVTKGGWRHDAILLKGLK
jgi:DNA-binding winged helix-turn-helix (wHTH) protein/Tol biopolymer transport system component